MTERPAGERPLSVEEARTAVWDGLRLLLRRSAAMPSATKIDAALDELCDAVRREERERVRAERAEAYAEGVRATHRIYAIRRGDAA